MPREFVSVDATTRRMPDEVLVSLRQDFPAPTGAGGRLQVDGVDLDPDAVGFPVEGFVERTGELLGTAHLDTIGKPGLYRQLNAADATPGRGYPVQDGAVLHVSGMTSTTILQELHPMGAGPSGRVVWRRVCRSAVWEPWRAYVAQRVDRTAGVTVHTWDPSQGAEVMVYGDTGPRQIDASYLINGWSFNIVQGFTLRRVGDVVSIVIPGLSLTGEAATSDSFMTLPAGFRMYTGGNYGGVAFLHSNGPVTLKKSFSDAQIESRSAVSGQASWITTDPWPTSLPGTPA